MLSQFSAMGFSNLARTHGYSVDYLAKKKRFLSYLFLWYLNTRNVLFAKLGLNW